jgi:serine/threonine-protein kinase
VRDPDAAPLRSGHTIGAYEVIALVDEGGQGAVYRARDTSLSRDVALKVVALERFDTRRRARFEREAQALATLNHPNIAMLLGVEHADGVAALVMELVEGESLAARLAHGAVPLAEALSIARQIADALETAHDHGIVHRDLKPANVMIRPDGTVKVLDFGLAKPFAEGGAGATALTLTATGDGVAIVGTAAYMSPEQARGAEVDRRTDVWAFGCVVYEMLTGRRAFDGGTASDIIASVLNLEPQLDALPDGTPPAIERLIRRALDKDARHRLRDIGDARLEIDEALAPRDRPGTRTAVRRTLASRWALGLAAAAVALLLWKAVDLREIAHLPISRFSVVFPPYARFAPRMGAGNLAISSDGSRIVYSSTQGFAVRSRDRLDVAVLQDTGAFAAGPSLSPDGQWLLFVDGSELKRVPVAGGRPSRVAEVGPGASASWGSPGILFADVNGVFRVAPEGGPVARVEGLQLDAGEHPAAPRWLPGGHAVIVTVFPSRANWARAGFDPAGSRIEVVDLRTRAQKTVLRGGSYASYLPVGILIYTSAQALAAVRFDPDRLETLGDPVRVDTGGFGEFAVSDEGTLVQSAGAGAGPSTLVWVDSTGREEPLGAPPGQYVYPRLSPDQNRVALVLFLEEDRDIWIWDLRRRALERFTVDPAANPLIAWSLDGSGLAFGSDRHGPTNLFWQRADGDSMAVRLIESQRIQMPVSFAPDGRLLFSHDVPGQGRNIEALTMDTHRVEPVISTPAQELNGEVSPDGNWIAYDSNESGQFEIYLRPYPPATGSRRWQASTGGGKQPLWSRNGRELFYRDFTGAVMSVPIHVTPAFEPGAPRKILDGSGYAGDGSFASGRTYDVGADGRFLMIKRATSDPGGPSLVVVQNWFAELNRLVPAR